MRRRGPLAFVGILVVLLTLAVGKGRAQSVWEQIAQFVGLPGKPEPASANVLSEHEIEALDQMSPQNQADLLLERSINHFRGANDQIAKRVDRWRGKIQLDQQLGSLFGTALNSDDLRVRAAAIEIASQALTWKRALQRLIGSSLMPAQASRADAQTAYGISPCWGTAV